MRLVADTNVVCRDCCGSGIRDVSWKPPRIVPTDPDNDHVLLCAVTGNAELIVSGDRDLLSLKTFHSIPIVMAAEAVQIITAA